MKNLFTRLMLVAVAAMGIVACQDGFGDVTIAPEASEVVMTITADADDTRTVLDEANKMVQWSDGDKLKVIENSKNYRTTTKTVITDGKAQFTVAFGEDTTSDSFTYNAFYPATAVLEDDAVNNAKVKVIVKDAQNPTATSFDPAADILVSKQIVTDAQPTELSMQFARLVALGKMTLTNLPTSSTISKVAFSVEGTDENNATRIAGRNYVDATTGVVSEYGYYGKTNTITLNYNEPISTRDIYFTCNPFVLVEGNKFTVKVTCNDYVYTREVTITEGRSLTFEQGNLNTFSVDMTSAIKEDNFVFPYGEYAVMAYNNGKYYALSCTNANNSTRLDSIDDVTYSGEGEFTTDNANLKWTIEYTEGEGYTFKDANGKYVAWYQTDDDKDNFARTQDDPYYLDIAKDGDTGRYTVTSKADASRKLQRNSSAKYFAFYTSNQWGSLCIVPVKIEVDTTPSITIDTTPVSFDYNANEGTIATTLKNLEISDVTVASSAQWLTANLKEGALNYNATANEGDERSAEVTLSAAGIDGIVITFTQAAKPAEVTGVWTLVTDASTLAVGDQIIIAASEYDYALSTEDRGNNRGAVAINKSETAVTFGDDVQILTLEAGTVDGTFALNTGSGYLYAASKTANQLKTKTTLDDNASWSVTVDPNGVASLTAQGTNTRNNLKFNNSNSPKLFSCYASGQSEVAIYRLGSDDNTGGDTGEDNDNPDVGGTTTVEMSTFTTTSASMDDVISYTTAKGGGTSNPAINNNEIRLYQNSAGTGGGYITVTAAEGHTISSLTIGSSMATSVAYTLDSDTTKSTTDSLSANGKYTIE
ncbi:MAG: BACON domain-containing protein [Alistipes sp.]|nr:BACON domain-containing protein [Alistipes sp.]